LGGSFIHVLYLAVSSLSGFLYYVNSIFLIKFYQLKKVYISTNSLGYSATKEKFNMPKAKVTIEEGGRSISITAKLPCLPEHTDFQMPFEVMISERIPLEDIVIPKTGKDEMPPDQIDKMILEEIERSSDRMIAGGIKFMRKVEANPYLMQRLCKWPNAIAELGNGPTSQYLLPKDYRASQTPTEQTEPLQPEPTQAPAQSPDPTPPEAVSGQADEVPVLDPQHNQKVADSLNRMADANLQKIEAKLDKAAEALKGQIHGMIMSAPDHRISYKDLRAKLSTIPKDVLNDAVSDMLDQWQDWNIYEPQIGIVSFMDPHKDKGFTTGEAVPTAGQETPKKPPEKPQDAPAPPPAEEGVSVRDRLAKGKETRRTAPPASTPKKQTILCYDCKKTFNDLDVSKVRAGACPHCGSENWGDPKSKSAPPSQTKEPVKNGSLDGKILRLIHDGHAVCPWCLDAGTVKAITKADADYTGKWGQKIVMCYDHRGEVKRNDAAPSTKKTQDENITKTIKKYEGQWEAI
jgi:hypothetical protein